MKKLLIVLICIGVLMVAAAYWISPSSHPGAETKFGITHVAYGTLIESVSATGQMAPKEVILVNSVMSGRVNKIYANADFNHFVDKDEPLFELDQEQAQILVRKAEAAVDAARANVTKAEAARNGAQQALDNVMSLDPTVRPKARVDEMTFMLNSAKAAVDAADGLLKQAQGALEEAQLGLNKTVVRAPKPGLILERKIYEGMMVGPQLPTPLFKIASDLGEMEVNAQVAEADTSKVRPNQDALFSVYAFVDEKFDGRVKQIHYLPNSVQGAVFYNTLITVKNRRTPDAQEAGNAWMRSQAGGVFASALNGPLRVLPWLQVRPDSDGWMLRPGMTATVDIVQRRHHNVWKMPTDAISFQLEKEYWTSAARAKVDQWKKDHGDSEDWKPVWVLKNKHPWPIYVRIAGKNAAGDTGIKDNQFIEVLDWDPEIASQLDPKDPKTYPEPINSAPPAHKKGFFDQPTKGVGLS